MRRPPAARGSASIFARWASATARTIESPSPGWLSRAGIDLRQPAIRPAAYACLPLTHGIISRADVNQAIANPDGGSQSSSAGG